MTPLQAAALRASLREHHVSKCVFRPNRSLAERLAVLSIPQIDAEGSFPTAETTSRPLRYVGLSAGSMVLRPNVGEAFIGWTPPTGADRTLGVVDFSLFPHLDHEKLPENSMADAERWAAGMPVPAYAIDDQTAIKVAGGAVEVVSEGHWKLFTPYPERLTQSNIHIRKEPSRNGLAVV
jgi:hypothetical protein